MKIMKKINLSLMIEKETFIIFSDIAELFLKYEEIYKEGFSLNKKNFTRIKEWKEAKGGVLITLIRNDNLLAFFTLTNGVNNFFELGDILKVKFKLHRNLFSKALNLACKEAITMFGKDGVFGYPNNMALNLELNAGFSIQSFYQKKIYLIIFGLKILLPFSVYRKKIEFNYDYLQNPFILSFLKNKLHKTKIKKINLINIYAISDKKVNYTDFLQIGLIYEFENRFNEGDPFITFGNNNFPKKDIRFINTDNSI